MSAGKWLRGDARDSLSPRELEVMGYVAQGKNNIQICMALGVGDTTVRRHIWNAKKKLHVSSRVELALKAIKIVAKPEDDES